MDATAARRELLELILSVSFRREQVTLASGKQSDFYLDLRQTLMRPRGVALAGDLVYERLAAGPPVEAVGGMAVGAVPLVTAVLATAAAREAETPLLGFFVRKQAKSHGLGRRIEGGFAPGQRVALVEDTVTTGRSTLEAMDAVEDEGGKVGRVLCLVDRGEGAAEAFRARGVEIEAIYTRTDLPV
ncbi:MAG: orotate phosphoribosyltransferase [Myxococcota bacterium]